MALDDTERLLVEDCIYECQISADKYLQTGKQTHANMLKYNIEQCLELFEEYKLSLQEDEEKDKYKLHLLVPLQLNELLKMRGTHDT